MTSGAAPKYSHEPPGGSESPRARRPWRRRRRGHRTARAREEAGRRLAAGDVVERCGDDHGDLTRMRLEQTAEPVQIVPRKLDEVLAVVGGHAGQPGHRPRPGAVIPA